jgi:hypothetical protein
MVQASLKGRDLLRQFTLTLFIAVIALAFVSAGTPVFASKPPPSFSDSCAVGGDTLVSWEHVHVTSLHFVWKDSSGNVVDIGNFQPHGRQFSIATPIGVDVGGSVSVTAAFNPPYNGASGAELAPKSCT